MLVPKSKPLSFRLECLNWPEEFQYNLEMNYKIKAD